MKKDTKKEEKIRKGRKESKFFLKEKIWKMKERIIKKIKEISDEEIGERKKRAKKK